MTAASDMTEHETPTGNRSTRRSRAMLASTLAAGLLLGACGGSGSAAENASEPAATSPVATAAPTTSSSADTDTAAPPATADPVAPAPKRDKAKAKAKVEAKATSTTAAAAPTPTTVALPVPIAAPADDEAPEPVVPLGTLAIPALGVERTFYEGIRLPTFDLGPGHWPGSALPGQPGNVVIGGHRTNANADFRDLDQLSAGDEMILTTNEGTSFTYVVESVEITDPFAAQVIHQTPRKTATLFACHPPGSIRQRIVVHLSLA